jgi:MraZ protein
MQRSGLKWSVIFFLFPTDFSFSTSSNHGQMFRGNSFHKIDPKGRLMVPARFREIIQTGGGNGIMLTQLDNCLYGYTYTGWKKIETRFQAKARSTQAMRRFRRIFIGGAYECPCDNQKRLLIPAPFREYAGLKREIVVVGVLDHFEIWAKKRWDQENELLMEDMHDEMIRREIAELGL